MKTTTLLLTTLLCGCGSIPKLPDITLPPIVQPDTEPDPDTGAPFELSEVRWCGSISDRSFTSWPVTHDIGAVRREGGRIRWDKAHPDTWSRSGRKNANLVLVTKINGQWCGAICEWLFVGLNWQAVPEAFKGVRSNGKVLFDGPLSGHVPKQGQEFYIFVCGLNWHGTNGTKERSTIAHFTY